MRVLELFAGTRSIGRAFERRGHEVFSVDWDEKFDDIDWCGDVEFLTTDMVHEMFGHPDVVWASPDCTSYSLAAIYRHRKKDPETGLLVPQTEYAKKCDRINWHLRELIEELRPTYWFIENPVGAMCKMPFISDKPRYRITYCQYTQDLPLEQRRMKPTNIWTNHPDPKFKPPCKNGDPCHVRAPRGARTGTQGLKVVDRSRIPDELCDHIVLISEETYPYEFSPTLF